MPDTDVYDDFPRGPSRRQTHGPLVEVYVDTEALDRKCPPPSERGCGVNAGEFCKSPDGRERKMPCLVRYAPPKTARLAGDALEAEARAEAADKARTKT